MVDENDELTEPAAPQVPVVLVLGLLLAVVGVVLGTSAVSDLLVR
jgi:hypothetical protein